jgi:hypothetical protein
MKSVFTIVVVLAALVTASNVFAVEMPETAKTETVVPATPEIVTVAAMVSVVKDAKGEITGVTLTEASGRVLNVVMSPEGKKLEQEGGKKVDATGTISDKEGQPWIDVKVFTLAPEVVPTE